MSVCLLLTATINVGTMLYSARNDPATRLADYRQALRFWVSANTLKKIIFCENSGADLDQLKDIVPAADGPVVEFIGFKAQGIDPRRGKGAGEMDILGHALSVSRLLEPGDHILKVTGRHILANAVALVSQVEYTDPPDIVCNLTRNLTYADSRVFVMRENLIRSHLVSIGNTINDSVGVHFEHVLAQAVLRSIADGYRWEMPAVRPDLRGISGTSGKSFGDGPLLYMTKAAKFRIKRRLFRGLG